MYSIPNPLKVPVGAPEAERKGDSLIVIHQVCGEEHGTDEEFPGFHNCTSHYKMS